ncbi:MAG: cell division protein ZapA [Pseudomonadota bacterium]|nr:cell division protein ZapA [Pseudomonadota bacterium]MEA3240951.1 cell division protein ZapA [Pseudomonadota bacterium]
MEKKSVTVSIKGQEYIIRTDSDEDHVKSVAGMVNEQLDLLGRKSQTISTVNLMVLTLMNVTGEYLQLKLELDSMTKRLEELNRRFPV